MSLAVSLATCWAVGVLVSSSLSSKPTAEPMLLVSSSILSQAVSLTSWATCWAVSLTSWAVSLMSSILLSLLSSLSSFELVSSLILSNFWATLVSKPLFKFLSSNLLKLWDCSSLSVSDSVSDGSFTTATSETDVLAMSILSATTSMSSSAF